MEDKLKKYEEIINEIQKYYIKKERTFFEITKYPYREKVSSNILVFFFDIKNEHNIQDLMIKALIMCINEKIKKEKKTILIDNNIEINELIVHPEYYTKKSNKLDILLYNNDFAIGIENKLDAILYNDLEDYAETIESVNYNNYKIVLSLGKENPGYGFINILYKDFIEKIEQLINERNIVQNKWIIFLLEFIETIKRREENINMDNEFSVWYENKEEDIREMIKKLVMAQRIACDKVNELGEYLDEAIKKYGYKTTRYNSDRNRIGIDLCYSICNIAGVKINDKISITIDNVYSPKGWELKFYTGKNARESVIKLLKEKGIDSFICDDTHIKLCDFEDNQEYYKNIIDMNVKILKAFN